MRSGPCQRTKSPAPPTVLVSPGGILTGVRKGPPCESSALRAVRVLYVMPSADLMTSHTLPSATGAFTTLSERLCNEKVTAISCPASTGVVTLAVHRARPPRMRPLELIERTEIFGPGETDVVTSMLLWPPAQAAAASAIAVSTPTLGNALMSPEHTPPLARPSRPQVRAAGPATLRPMFDALSDKLQSALG